MRIKPKHTKTKLNNSGMTLVEMLVTFALLSIFLVCATMIISSTIETYYDAKSMDNGMQVSGIIMEKITRELESATYYKQNMTDTNGTTIENVAMLVDGDQIEFTNLGGSHVRFHLTDDGYLSETYYPVYNISGEEKYKQVEWTFDDKMYMGYTIKSLTFSMAGTEYPNHIIRVDLNITNGKYGDFSTTQYVECFNFKGKNDAVRTAP